MRQDSIKMENVKLDQAIEKALTKHVYTQEAFDAMKKSRARCRPELLHDAAIECFLHEQEPEVEETIRVALILLRQTGLLSKE